MFSVMGEVYALQRPFSTLPGRPIGPPTFPIADGPLTPTCGHSGQHGTSRSMGLRGITFCVIVVVVVLVLMFTTGMFMHGD